MDMFFRDPPGPWERGSNKNANGLAREFLPNGMDLSKVVIQGTSSQRGKSRVHKLSAGFRAARCRHCLGGLARRMIGWRVSLSMTTDFVPGAL
jgi:hypothetical protein